MTSADTAAHAMVDIISNGVVPPTATRGVTAPLIPNWTRPMTPVAVPARERWAARPRADADGEMRARPDTAVTSSGSTTERPDPTTTATTRATSSVTPNTRPTRSVQAAPRRPTSQAPHCPTAIIPNAEPAITNEYVCALRP